MSQRRFVTPAQSQHCIAAIKRCVAASGQTCAALARQWQTISESQLASIVAGRVTKITETTAQRLAVALQMPLAELLGPAEAPNPYCTMDADDFVRMLREDLAIVLDINAQGRLTYAGPEEVLTPQLIEGLQHHSNRARAIVEQEKAQTQTPMMVSLDAGIAQILEALLRLREQVADVHTDLANLARDISFLSQAQEMTAALVRELHAQGQEERPSNVTTWPAARREAR